MTDTIAGPLLGGALLGLSASSLLLINGRIAGVSGIFAGLLKPRAEDATWRVLFVAGLIAGGLVAAWLRPAVFASTIQRPMLALAAAGLLVGFGTRLGNGCTSGHGICGVGRFSARSMVATATFIGAGVATVFVTYGLFGAT